MKRYGIRKLWTALALALILCLAAPAALPAQYLPGASALAAGKVALNKAKATIYNSQSVQLKLKNARGTVKWKSSNKKVATVSGKGKVTGKKAGTATITVHTESGKSATTEITVVVSCQSLSFNKSEISIKKGDTEMIAIDDRTTLDALIGHNCNGGAPLRIGENLLGPTIVSSYNCLVGSDLSASKFNITVPFPGEGTETEPWLIQGAEKLSLLAKCVNVGAYDFADKYVKLDNGESYSYDMSAYNNPESEKCFEPIGLTGDINQIPFCGIFDGNNVTISGINYSFDPGAIVGDLSFVNSIGLFGQLGDVNSEPIGVGVVKNVKLENCTFDTNYDGACFVGGIAGYIDRGGIYGSTVSSSTVSAAARILMKNLP